MKIKIKKYKELLEYLKEMAHFEFQTENSKVALAFLIEIMSEKNPENWQNDFEKFKKNVDEAMKKGGKVEVSWFLSEFISNIYIDFLKKREESVEDEELKRKLVIIRQMQENSMEFNRKTHQNGEQVAFGGILKEYIPEWYYIEK